MVKNLLPREEQELLNDFKVKKIKALNYAVELMEKEIQEVGASEVIEKLYIFDLEELINEIGVDDDKFIFEIRVCNGVIYATFKGCEYIGQKTNISGKHFNTFVNIALKKVDYIKSKLGIKMLVDAREEKEKWCNCPYCTSYLIQDVNEENERRETDLFYSEMESLGCLHNCGLED